MSLSAESLNLHCECIVTEHVINNRDPLVARKKACQGVLDTPPHILSKSARIQAGLSGDKNKIKIVMEVLSWINITINSNQPTINYVCLSSGLP